MSMLAFLTPLALLEYHWMSPEARCTHDLTARRPDLDYPVGVYVVIAGLGWSTSLLTWATALQYTSTVRASILTSLHTLYLVLYIHFTGGAVSMHEWCGVLVVMMGILIIGSDGLLGPPDPQYANISTANMLFGDILCLISALAQAVVIMNRKKTRKYIALMQYTVCTTSIVVTFGSLAAMVLEGATLFDLGNNSLLGWMSPNWLPMMLVFGLFVGVFCICGFNYAAAHIAPLVFSALTLLDPAFTGIISWLAGLERVPDLTVWLGGTTVIAGVGLLTYAEHARESAKGKSDQHSTQEAAPENGAPDGAIAPVPRARALSVEHMGRDRSGSSASRAGRGTQLASFIKEQVVNPISALLTNGVAYSSVSGDAGSRGVADAEHDAQDDADVELSDMKGLYGGSIPGYSMLSQSGDSHGDYSGGDGIDRHSRDIEQGEQADCGVGGSSEQDENEMHHELDHGDGSFNSATQPPQQTTDIEEYGIRRRSASTATSSGAVAGIDTAQYQPIAAITPPPPNGSFSDSPLRGARRSRSGTTTSGADGV